MLVDVGDGRLHVTERGSGDLPLFVLHGGPGHSYGALIALQHAVDFAGRPAATVVSSGFPDAGFLDHVEGELEAFEPIEPREQVKSSWAPEAHARTCSVAAAQAIAAGLSDAELAILEHSGHMTFVEENDAYVAAVPRFLLSAG